MSTLETRRRHVIIHVTIRAGNAPAGIITEDPCRAVENSPDTIVAVPRSRRHSSPGHGGGAEIVVVTAATV